MKKSTKAAAKPVANVFAAPFAAGTQNLDALMKAFTGGAFSGGAFSGGKSYEVAWTTNGTGCETPWKLCAAGSPVSDPNSLCVNLSEDVSAGISKTGGVLNVTAADLAGLSSDTGWYHVMVGSYYGSHNGTVAFYLQK